jgi:hypothetical protein
MSALGLLHGVLLATHLIAIANEHSSARAEALAKEVPAERLAPILDVKRLPEMTEDGRTISRSPGHHLQNVLRKRIGRGEIPAPETAGVSMAMLMRVSGALAELNRDDLGAFASLTFLSERCDASPSQIRAVYAYLVEHGHALRLPRITPEDRMIGGAKRPLVATRTTIRPVYPITCDMAETLSETDVLDLIAVGERKPRAELPNSASEGAPPHHVAASSSAPPEPAPPPEPEPTWEPAPEHRCLVEPLAALSVFTGISLPTDVVQWAADEAHDAGLVDVEHVDLTHAADAIQELRLELERARNDAAAMGDPVPTIRGRAHILKLIRGFFGGKRRWLSNRGDVYQARDEAREREQTYEATLTPEQRQRRGLEPAALAEDIDHVDHGAGVLRELGARVAEIARLEGRIALLGARIFAEQVATRKATLEAERADAEHELAELRERGPPPF